MNNNESLNKLFLTFTLKEDIENILNNIKSSYTILYNKIFIFEIENSNEFAITYNIECGNINNIPLNTISIHRHKEYNTLYSINGLNTLVASLNGGIQDRNFIINWKDYQNSILLNDNKLLRILKTKIYRIVEL